jgi:uridine kinase
VTVAAPTARVVLLSGPSGAGKSRLAARLRAERGWPVVRLDDFYRDEDDPSMPRSEELGIVDWDDPRSWNADAAVTALEALVRDGSAAVPVYDLSRSRATGSTQVVCGDGDLVLAEGIFAAELVRALRERELLHRAYVVCRDRRLTFLLRLVRDLRERRKPPLVLLRRGLALMREEPEVVERAVRLGGTVASPDEVLVDLGAAGGATTD